MKVQGERTQAVASARGPWVCLTHRVGQLGNRLFVSAHVMAWARQQGLRGWNLALAEYADLFLGSVGAWRPELTRPGSGRGGPPSAAARRWLARWADGLAAGLGRIGRGPWRTVDLLRSHDPADRVFPLEESLAQPWWAAARGVFLRGWKFRVSGGLEPHGDFLRAYFTPISSVARGVERVLQEARSLGEVRIGVHVRRGDYRDWLGGRYFFEHACYARWMEEAAACWPGQRVVFVVCSNEPWPETWRQKFTICAGPGDAVGDLYALAGCDAMLAPPSSFALWASFIGQTPLQMLESPGQKVHPVTFTFHPGA